MKKLNIREYISLGLYLCLFAVLIGSLAGCMGAAGETTKEVHTRHVGVVKTNWIQAQNDIDAVLMLDKPSRLSDKLIR